MESLIPQKQIRGNVGSVPDASAKDQIKEIEVGLIQPNPHQPREDFDRASLEDLINSIKEHGIIQPLVAQKHEDGYQLIAGERRLRAAKVLKMKKVPVVIRSATEQQKLELALVENVQRQNLNAIERAYGYLQLVDEFNITQEEVAKKVGQSRAAVTNTIRLLTLPIDIQTAIKSKKITEGHAKVLLGVKSQEEQNKIFKDILRDNLSVRSVESAVKKVVVRKHTRSRSKDPNLEAKEQQLQEALGTKVEISKTGQQGTVKIHFYSGEELYEIIKKISR